MSYQESVPQQQVLCALNCKVSGKEASSVSKRELTMNDDVIEAGVIVQRSTFNDVIRAITSIIFCFNEDQKEKLWLRNTSSLWPLVA